MLLKIGEMRHGFRLIESHEVKEIDSIASKFVHEKTNVTLLTLINKDPHKVFTVNVQTLPTDNKGTAHIIEHSVCCASKNYPLKETLMALEQGSICTTINACTYSDRTMYYAAGSNQKDLLGVMGVYMDLIFEPLMEQDSTYFYQEGWHYEINEEEQLEISGVVYNEMLGIYSEPGSYLKYYELAALFEETPYCYDAGGLPTEIITLSEKELLDFYKRHYVGDNTILTLYGNYDLEEVLEKLNQDYLKGVKKGQAFELIEDKKSFTSPHYTVAYYPNTLTNAPTLASLCFVVGGCKDPEERLALEILEHILLRSTASPLSKALIIDRELGISLSDGGYDSCRTQPVFSITLKGTTKEKALHLEEEIMAILRELSQKGIDPKLIEAAIHTLTFELRERDDTYEPMGISYSEMMVTSLYAKGNAFEQLHHERALEKIRVNASKGYFEKLIDRYFLQNNHRVLTILIPSKPLQQEQEAALEAKLEQQYLQMSDKEKEKLEALNERMNEKQLEENSEEALRKLPHLTREDLPKQLERMQLERCQIEDCTVQVHLDDTKGVNHFHFLWQADHIPESEWQVLGLLAHIFTYVGTKQQSFSELENTINSQTGSLTTALHAYQLEDGSKVVPIFKVSGKVLTEDLSQLENLLYDIFTQTQFTEKEKLKELIGHIVYEFESSFVGAPEYRTVQRVYAYLSPEGRYEDEVAGMQFYHKMKDILNDFDKAYPELVRALETVYTRLINKTQLKVSLSCSTQDQQAFLTVITRLIKRLPGSTVCNLVNMKQWFKEQPLLANEGFINGQDTQAVALGVFYKQKDTTYRGQMEVVANVLENMYLWDRVRLQGGAYGCDIMLTKEGYLSICSYCDPHCIETLEIFKSIGTYLKQMKLSQEIIDRAIISTLGAMLMPEGISQKSERAAAYMITGGSDEIRQHIYDEIRETTLEDFHQTACIFNHLAEQGMICIMGNKEKLEKEKATLTLIDLDI